MDIYKDEEEVCHEERRQEQSHVERQSPLEPSLVAVYPSGWVYA